MDRLIKVIDRTSKVAQVLHRGHSSVFIHTFKILFWRNKFVSGETNFVLES